MWIRVWANVRKLANTTRKSKFVPEVLGGMHGPAARNRPGCDDGADVAHRAGPDHGAGWLSARRFHRVRQTMARHTAGRRGCQSHPESHRYGAARRLSCSRHQPDRGAGLFRLSPGAAQWPRPADHSGRRLCGGRRRPRRTRDCPAFLRLGHHLFCPALPPTRRGLGQSQRSAAAGCPARHAPDQEPAREIRHRVGAAGGDWFFRRRASFGDAGHPPCRQNLSGGGRGRYAGR